MTNNIFTCISQNTRNILKSNIFSKDDRYNALLNGSVHDIKCGIQDICRMVTIFKMLLNKMRQNLKGINFEIKGGGG